MIGIELDSVCFMILKARQLDMKEPDVDEDSGSNAIDDGFTDVMTDDGEDATEEELRSFINDLDVEKQARLVALTWVGRGDYDRSEWKEAVRLAAERQGGSTADYLLGTPLLGDYLEEGLAAFDLSCAGEDLTGDLPEGAPKLRREDP